MTPTATLLAATLGMLALGGALALGVGPGQEDQAAAKTPTEIALPDTHHGNWAGPNRLWIFDPTTPDRSDGTVEVAAKTVRYTWSRGDKAHEGVIELAGQPAALRCDWTDTFHAGNGMTLNGYEREGVVYLYGTYPVGEGQPEWGWQIQLDARDREAFVMRMFNVVPGHGPMPAVVLYGTR